MHQDLLFDTNIVIDYLSKYQDDLTKFFELQKITERFSLSVISVCELFAYPGLSEDEEKRIAVFTTYFNVIPINEEIAKRAGLLARTRPSRNRRSDLFIAASALTFNMPIMTKNQKDFTTIPGLTILES